MERKKSMLSTLPKARQVSLRRFSQTGDQLFQAFFNGGRPRGFNGGRPRRSAIRLFGARMDKVQIGSAGLARLNVYVVK
jgi:hypothetical protein